MDFFAAIPGDLFRELVSKYFLPRDFPRSETDDVLFIDRTPFPVVLVVLQLLNKRFRQAVCDLKTLTGKWIENQKNITASARKQRLEHSQSAHCQRFGSVSLLQWTSSYFNIPVCISNIYHAMMGMSNNLSN